MNLLMGIGAIYGLAFLSAGMGVILSKGRPWVEKTFLILLAVGVTGALSMIVYSQVRSGDRLEKELNKLADAMAAEKAEEAKNPKFYRIVLFKPSGDSEVYSPVNQNSTSFDGAGVRFLYQDTAYAFDNYRVKSIPAPQPESR